MIVIRGDRYVVEKRNAMTDQSEGWLDRVEYNGKLVAFREDDTWESNYLAEIVGIEGRLHLCMTPEYFEEFCKNRLPPNAMFDQYNMYIERMLGFNMRMQMSRDYYLNCWLLNRRLAPDVVSLVYEYLTNVKRQI